ncbi:MAG: ABC transporter ATP-binding protein, partial [Thermoanaerobaculia bacterium]|nr:ABC transporter ATP-binding protein [Thermoanaerobaculia bacterium]
MAGRIVVDFTRELPSLTVRASGDFPLEADSTLVLFGPSGSGKSTVLRAIAGLDRPDSGTIRFGDTAWFDRDAGIDVPPQKRRIGYLSQNYDLFPHLTVRENIAYGAAGETRIETLLERLGIRSLSDRLPPSLSGGEGQRVALARAVARKPRILLLDEPLSALDTPTREILREELRSILSEAAVPSILVTHDRSEALALGDTIAVVIGGRIVQSGPVESVFNHPRSVEVARATGIETVLPVRIVSLERDLVVARHGSIDIEAALNPSVRGHEKAFALIRASDVTIDRERLEGISARNQLAGTVRSVVKEDPLVRLVVDSGFELTALITMRSFEDL